jgi:hypothetical protein
MLSCCCVCLFGVLFLWNLVLWVSEAPSDLFQGSEQHKLLQPRVATYHSCNQAGHHVGAPPPVTHLHGIH